MISTDQIFWQTKNSQQIGKLGEEIATNFLIKNKYKILGRNFIPQWSRGINRPEIDIIAKKKRVIVFVEVKSLQVNFLVQKNFFPEDKINFYKLKQINKAAESYFLEKNISFQAQKYQIDIVSILIDSQSDFSKIKHFKNVFEAKL